MGNVAGSFIQLPVSQCSILKGHRHIVWCFFQLRFKQIDYGFICGVISLGIIEIL